MPEQEQFRSPQEYKRPQRANNNEAFRAERLKAAESMAARPVLEAASDRAPVYISPPEAAQDAERKQRALDAARDNARNILDELRAGGLDDFDENDPEKNVA